MVAIRILLRLGIFYPFSVEHTLWIVLRLASFELELSLGIRVWVVQRLRSAIFWLSLIAPSLWLVLVRLAQLFWRSVGISL